MSWLDEPRNVTRLVNGLVGVGGLLVLADLLYDKHPYFAFERWFGFFAWFGFVVSVALVLGAKRLRPLLKRDEDYYEPLDRVDDDD